MEDSMNHHLDFESLLSESARTHGHLCSGQLLGVRMSILGLKQTGIEDPKGKDRKSVIVFVETDRCSTDAIQSAVLPGAIFLLAYIRKADFPIPVLGIPACGMYHKTTVFDLILPRILAGESIGRRELAEHGHGGLCLNCKECRYPVCTFGK